MRLVGSTDREARSEDQMSWYVWVLITALWVATVYGLAQLFRGNPYCFNCGSSHTEKIAVCTHNSGFVEVKCKECGEVSIVPRP